MVEGGRSVAWADLLTALALIALSAVVYRDAATYPEALAPGAPGPALFPHVLASALIVLALVLLGTSLRSKGPKEAGDPRRAGRVLVACVLLAAFLYLFESVNSFLLFPVLLFAFMLVLGERRWYVLLVVPLLFDLFTYTVFYKVFQVMLPGTI